LKTRSPEEKGSGFFVSEKGVDKKPRVIESNNTETKKDFERVVRSQYSLEGILKVSTAQKRTTGKSLLRSENDCKGI
jgi:hypothetical protein